tara:strand:+ start:2793 stop:4094 length:1302 start_codon:yes stop_codon:yes gene_type:complete
LINYLTSLSPVKKNLTAGIITLIVRTISALFLIPFYINFLGKDTYADWIILYSVPAVFELTNLGINKGVNNTFSFLYNNKKINQAKQIISKGIILTLALSLISIITLSIVWNLVDIYNFLGLDKISVNSSLLILGLLTLKIFIEMIRGILCSFFIAENESYKTTALNLFQYVIEVLAIISLIYFGYSLLTVAACLSIIALCIILYLIIYNYFKYDYRLKIIFNLKENNEFIAPSFGFSIITISRYVRDQGLLIIIKNFFNSEALIIFNTTNTLVNYINVLNGQIYAAISPVFNYYFSKKFFNQIKNLFIKSVSLSIISSLIIGILIYLFRDLIWTIWLNNIIIINELLLLLLLLTALLNGIWIIPKSVLEGSNKHLNFSIYELVVSFLVIASVIILFQYKGLLLSYIPIVLIIYHLIFIIYFYSRIKKILKPS